MNRTGATVSQPAQNQQIQAQQSQQLVDVPRLIKQLVDGNQRDNALAELSRQREQVPNLAVSLWESFGTFILFKIIANLAQAL